MRQLAVRLQATGSSITEAMREAFCPVTAMARPQTARKPARKDRIGFSPFANAIVKVRLPRPALPLPRHSTRGRQFPTTAAATQAPHRPTMEHFPCNFSPSPLPLGFPTRRPQLKMIPEPTAVELRSLFDSFVPSMDGSISLDEVGSSLGSHSRAAMAAAAAAKAARGWKGRMAGGSPGEGQGDGGAAAGESGAQMHAKVKKGIKKKADKARAATKAKLMKSERGTLKWLRCVPLSLPHAASVPPPGPSLLSPPLPRMRTMVFMGPSRRYILWCDI